MTESSGFPPTQWCLQCDEYPFDYRGLGEKVDRDQLMEILRGAEKNRPMEFEREWCDSDQLNHVTVTVHFDYESPSPYDD